MKLRRADHRAPADSKVPPTLSSEGDVKGEAGEQRERGGESGIPSAQELSRYLRAHLLVNSHNCPLRGSSHPTLEGVQYPQCFQSAEWFVVTEWSDFLPCFSLGTCTPVRGPTLCIITEEQDWRFQLQWLSEKVSTSLPSCVSGIHPHARLRMMVLPLGPP